MPGITGIFGSASREHAALVQSMSRVMLHEDFYTSGTYINRELGVCSTLIAGNNDSAPELVLNESQTVGCFLAGESQIEGDQNHDSESEFGKESAARGLIRLYEKVGLEALEKLNGWFSGLLVDIPGRHAILFNDRFGLNRIYVYEEANRLMFSSEAKSLLAIRPHLRELDPRGLAEWFSCGCVLGNRSLFRGISLLPPGSAWVFSSDGTLQRKNYFRPSTWEQQSILSQTEFFEQLEQVFPNVLKRYVGGTRPVAMSLTGGLDGRMIMAWARSKPGEMPCYTFNGSYRDCADVRIARRVAKACGQPHQTISIGDDFIAQFPRLAEQTVRITDGAMDVTGAAEVYVNRLARRIAPVRLTGNYGSEILRRYVAFKPRSLPTKVFDAGLVSHLSAVGRTYSEEANGNPLSFIAFKQVPWHHYARFAIEQSQITLRSPFLDNDLVSLAYRTPPELATSVEPSLALIAQGNAILGQIPTDRGITYPAHRFSNGLNRSVQEFLAKAEYAYDYGMPNWLSRINRWFAPLHVERLFLGRQKFVHFRTWYANELSHYVKEVLLDPRSRSRNYLNAGDVEKLVDSHVKGLSNHTTEIHKLLSIELLNRVILEDRGNGSV